MITFSEELERLFCLNYGVRNLLEDLQARDVGYNGEWVNCCCYFHEERNASFGLRSDNGHYYCFTCGASGSLYKFVKTTYHLSYEEVEKFLIQRAGIDPDTNLDDLTLIRDIDSILKSDEIVETVAEQCPIKFGQAEWDAMHECPDPHNYLLGRGFTKATLKRFQIGYTSKWKMKRKDGSYGLEERVVIPGFDEDGNVIGFIGRSPVGEEPKYRYTYKFPKLYTLFNLHRAKLYGDYGIILVEGSLDAIQIDQHGFPNVCAILGSELSGAQLNLLKRYTDRLFFCFDNDAAGAKATIKAAELAGSKFDCSIVKLRQFKDPGEIKESDVFAGMMKKAVDLDTYSFTKHIKKLGGDIKC